jgi:hypothetical protein
VDVAAKEAMIVIPSKGVQGTPASLFFPEQGRLVEKILSAGSPDVSALIFEENGAFYSVLADARLIRSLLFRLYYLNGEGLMFFKPVLSRGTLRGGTVVRVFKLDTEKFSA